MAKGILVDKASGETTTEGRLQMYLVLGALACGDLEYITAFIKHEQAIKGRYEMYKSLDAFRARAPIALKAAGFSPDFVKAIDLETKVNEKIFNALSVLRSELRLLDDDYDAPDCPCIEVLVTQAKAAEVLLEPLRKVNVATQRALTQLQQLK